MSYEIVENALVIQLETLSGIFAKGTVSRGDQLILNKGPERAVILLYADFEQQEFAMDSVKHVWSITLLVHVKYRSDAQVQNDARDTRQAIIDRISTHPTLNRTA